MPEQPRLGDVDRTGGKLNPSQWETAGCLKATLPPAIRFFRLQRSGALSPSSYRAGVELHRADIHRQIARP